MKHRNFTIENEPVRLFIFLIVVLALFPLKGQSFDTLNAIALNIASEVSIFEENGKVGLKNNKGEILIPASYEALGWSDGNFSVVQNVTGYKSKGEWGLINLNNHRVTKAEYAEIKPGSNALLIARKKFPNSFRLPYGCLTTGGKVVIPFAYDGITISGIRAIVFQKVSTKLKYGLIDLNNQVIIPLTNQLIYPLGSLRYAVVDENNKTAIFSEEGKQITQFVIDSISAFKKNYAVIFQNQKQGLINRDGLIAIEPVYREIDIDENSVVRKRKSDLWSFITGENKVLREIGADSVNDIFANTYEIKFGNKVQLTDKEFKPVNETLFTEITAFAKQKAYAKIGKNVGVISSTGKVIIPAQSEQLIFDHGFYRSLQKTDLGKRWLLLDSLGKALTTKTYEYIGPFNGSFFPAKNRNFWGGLDSNGKEIIACTHDSIIHSLNKYVVVKFKGQYGIISTDERWIITPQPNRLQLLEKERYLETTSANKLIKNMKGEIIYFTSNPIEIKSDYILEFLPDGVIWKIDVKGIVTNSETAPSNIEKIYAESEGYRAIKKDGRYGFVDNRLRLRIANRYEDVKPFSEGLAPAKILGKWGYINKEDNIAIQPVYDEVTLFKNGNAVVKKNNLLGIIDKQGKLILPVRYEALEITSNKRIVIRQNGFMGLADNQGRIILNPKYQVIHDLNNGYVIVKQNEKYGIVNLDGVTTVPIIYDWITADDYHNAFIAMQKSEWEITQLQ